ncbi:sensor histidine kinase [Fluviicola taffensis]|uniref:Signal transduction histidine kinase, LytS n=1 Tax=Fluviicola taffensis (strain DSM 16823 / NCIMB 13979 / RW262) TaxID=755732 RepID=F2IBI7_FLUTR|nr:histidine kinase [Fluviicola taffensis]AEA44295.1 signal transduction histidine kinase, LytS [Fluviicola taffensis DSM 16823]
MYKKATILIIVLLVATRIGYSQKIDWEPSFTNFSVNEGLPSSETYYVHQDRKGFIWICTDRGVVKYDGYRFKVFTKKDGLVDNVVFKVMEDYKGRIWFISYNNLLCYYENDKIRPYKFNAVIKKYRGRNYVPFSWVSIDKQDNLFFSVKKKPILKISKTGKSTVLNKNEPISYTKINGRWLFSSTPIIKIHEKIQLCYDGNKSWIDSRSSASDFAIDRQEIQQFGNTIYITNNSNVYSSKGDSCIVDFIVGTNKIGKDLWVETLKGVYFFENIEKKGLKSKPKQFLKQYAVTSVCKDNEGGYWFSTLENGVVYSPNLTILNSKFSDNPRENNLQDVYKNREVILVSNINGYYNFQSKKSLSKVARSYTNVIPFIGKTPFIATSDILNEQKKTGLVFFHFGFTNWCPESDTSVLISGSGVARVNIHGKKKMLHHPIVESEKFRHIKYQFKSVVLLPNKELYIADLKGLFKYTDGVFKPVTIFKQLKDTRIAALEYSNHWGLIIATSGKGIFIVRNEKVIKIIGEHNGLLSNHINRLYVDNENYLYVCSNKGVSRILFDGKTRYEIQNVTNFQGISASEVNACFKYDKTIYLATKGGLSKLDQSYNWINSSHTKQITVLDVFANGRRIGTRKNLIALDHRSKVIKIRLSTTNFKTKKRSPYKFRLSKNSSWIEGYSGEILLLNPAYEKFNIEIQYKNENGIWSKPYFLISVQISPPFYQTIWFFILVTICLLALVAFILARRIRAINRKNEIQRNMEHLEQKALLAQMNPHFIFNALNSIQSFLLYEENELAERYLLKLSQLIRMTLTNSRESEITIEKEIDALKKYLELEQMRFKNRFEFNFQLSLSASELSMFIPPMLVQPFAENSIIHGFKNLKGGGEITIRFLKIEGHLLFVEIIDNGVGFQSTLQKSDLEHKSYGTKITTERLDLFKQRYGGEFKYRMESNVDSDGNPIGTIVKMTIPVIQK